MQILTSPSWYHQLLLWHHGDASSASCKDCGDMVFYASVQAAVLLAIVAALALLRLAFIRAPRLLWRVSSQLAQLMAAAQQFGLQSKCEALPTLNTALRPFRVDRTCDRPACASQVQATVVFLPGMVGPGVCLRCACYHHARCHHAS